MRKVFPTGKGSQAAELEIDFENIIQYTVVVGEYVRILCRVHGGHKAHYIYGSHAAEFIKDFNSQRGAIV
jgi:hypothetical protein